MRSAFTSTSKIQKYINSFFTYLIVFIFELLRVNLHYCFLVSIEWQKINLLEKHSFHLNDKTQCRTVWDQWNLNGKVLRCSLIETWISNSRIFKSTHLNVQKKKKRQTIKKTFSCALLTKRNELNASHLW